MSTDNDFKPPEILPPPDAKQAFNFFSGIFIFVIFTMSAFWALLVKKPGTIGRIAYLTDSGFSFVVILALSQNGWYPDKYIFTACLVVLPILYCFHLVTSAKSEKHVHSRCIGASRFGRGDKGPFLEFVFGLCLGVVCILAGCAPFGFFLMICSTASTIRFGMIEERDRQRSIQMADAIAEQEIMMEQYEKYMRQRNQK